MFLTFLKNNMHMCTMLFNQSYKIFEKEKYTSHTIAFLTVFTRAFCTTRVENLLKGPDFKSLNKLKEVNK